eukprot:SAG22_NODE_4607_length_1219_cov_1.529464_2_plen_169_part_00
MPSLAGSASVWDLCGSSKRRPAQDGSRLACLARPSGRRPVAEAQSGGPRRGVTGDDDAGLFGGLAGGKHPHRVLDRQDPEVRRERLFQHQQQERQAEYRRQTYGRSAPPDYYVIPGQPVSATHSFWALPTQPDEDLAAEEEAAAQWRAAVHESPVRGGQVTPVARWNS